MAQKPRVKAPQKRSTAKAQAPDRRRLLIIGGAALTLLVAAAGAFFLLGAAKGASPSEARAALEEADCTFVAKPAVANLSDHSDFPDPDATSKKWNTDPPTSGPHYGGTLIYGAYTDPIQIGRVVHNLEHGAAFILFGRQVPAETLEQLREFYDDHKNGTVLAPYAKLGKEIALGAWYAEGLPDAESDRGTGVLAKCSKFDEAAFGDFFDAFQFKGPESPLLRPSDMQPGDT
jgi:hypothetical protein